MKNQGTFLTFKKNYQYISNRYKIISDEPDKLSGKPNKLFTTQRINGRFVKDNQHMGNHWIIRL